MYTSVIIFDQIRENLKILNFEHKRRTFNLNLFDNPKLM